MTDPELNDPALDPTELGEVAPDVQRAFADLVRGVEVGPALRARVERGVRSGPSRLGSLPMRRALAAAAAVAVLVGGVAVLGGSGDDRDEVVTVSDDPDGGSSTRDTPPPTVGGVTITRPEGDAAASTTAAEVATTVPTAVIDGTPETTPPTVALVCRNSFDPACGAFFWDPEPIVGQSMLQVRLPADGPRVGVPYDVVVELTDPTARPTFNCADFVVSPNPDVTQVGAFGCTFEPAPACAAQYGPWTPPEPSGGTIAEPVSVTFSQPGTHTITVATRAAAQQCGNPYGSDATTTVTVEVLPSA
jgi:hypothetical protein